MEWSSKLALNQTPLVAFVLVAKYKRSAAPPSPPDFLSTSRLASSAGQPPTNVTVGTASYFGVLLSQQVAQLWHCEAATLKDKTPTGLRNER